MTPHSTYQKRFARRSRPARRPSHGLRSRRGRLGMASRCCKRRYEHQRRLKALAPALVDECLIHARVLEAQLAALAAQRIDEGLLDRQARTHCWSRPRAVRQYQFVGELAQTLDYFRQRFLSATEERALRGTIREQGLAVEQAPNGLLGHVINEVLFDSEERSTMRRTAHELHRLGKLLEKPRDSGVLKSDYTVRRRQFIRQAGGCACGTTVM